jgi:hypothetical protein
VHGWRRQRERDHRRDGDRPRDAHVLARLLGLRGRLAERSARHLEHRAPRHPDRSAVRQQRQGAAEAHGRAAGRRAAGYHLPVRVVAAAGGARPRSRRPHRLDPAAGRELGRLHPGRPRRRDLRGQGAGRSGAGRQPGHRLQQGAIRRGWGRVPERRLDVGRPPVRGEGAHRSGPEGVRFLLSDGRLRGLRGTTTRSCGRTGARS